MTTLAAPKSALGASFPAPTAAPIRCLLVDDHPAIRLGLRELLEEDPGFTVLDSLSTAESGLAFAERATVDVAVLDYQLGGHSGLWLCRKLKQLPDPPAVLIYTAYSDSLLAAASVVAQADGLISKGSLGVELCRRIREVHRGVTQAPLLPPSLAASLRRRLDETEQAIYGLMLASFTLDEVARTLGLSGEELERRRSAMMGKLERADPVR